MGLPGNGQGRGRRIYGNDANDINWFSEEGMAMTAMRHRMGILVGATLLLSACAGYGPTTISRDRFDYTAAISDSWKHQMLFNMVKIRYGDAPVFMDVTSVISQYQIAGQINLAGTINSNPWSNSEVLGAQGQYVDRPTISFTPVLGPGDQRHSESLRGGGQGSIRRPRVLFINRENAEDSI
jgi:hypothetical protein